MQNTRSAPRAQVSRKSPSLLSFDNYAARARIERLISRVHSLGERAIGELLDELAREHGIADDIRRRLESYSKIDPKTLAALGGDRHPAAPLRLAP